MSKRPITFREIVAVIIVLIYATAFSLALYGGFTTLVERIVSQ